jgi:hypothetical protein
MIPPTSHNNSVGTMKASANDPWIGVHTLTEFIFCPRAGLIQYESQDIENDGEVEIPQLNYLADWNEVEIERNLKQLIPKMWLLIVIFITLILVIPFFHGLLGFIPIIGILIAGKFLVSNLLDVVKLNNRLNKARNAQPAEPPDVFETDYPINWWSLLKSSYESIRYKESLRDTEWRLAGKPWRVLRKGSKRIPIFRMRSGEPRIYPQHRARMAAYCHLLERSEGAESPYGIVIYPGESYDGLAIANQPGTRKIFHNQLKKARSVILNASHNIDPPPGDSHKCKNCPCGRPFVYRPGQTENISYGNPLPVYGRDGVDERMYHSACGDRFRWVPPHAKAFEKEL